MDKDKTTPPLFDEIAFTTGGRDITSGFSDSLLLRPRDNILATRGGGSYRVYEELLTDWQVKSTFQQRRLAVVSREWEVEAGGTGADDLKAADFLREQLDAINWDDKTHKMLAGVFYGYAVAEAIWARDGQNIVLDDLKVRRRERFRFGQSGELRLLTRDSPMDGEIMPPRKFWSFSTGADDDDEPYGLGLAHWLYWPVWFKRNGVKFWLIFLEKFGAPTPVGKFPPSALPEDRQKLLEAVAAIYTDSGVIIPEGMMIELLEATRAGAGSHKEFQDQMDSAISKVVLSQTMTTDDGSSLAQASVHEDVKQEVVKADSDLICGSFNNGPVRWLSEWNFPSAKPPKVWRRIDDEPDLKPVAERDKLIHDMGFEPSEQYITETYGEGWVKKAATENRDTGEGAGTAADEGGEESQEFAERCPGCGAPRHTAGFAEGDGGPQERSSGPSDPADALTDPAEAEAEKAQEALIDRFSEIVAGAENLEDVVAGFLRAYPDVATDELADSIRRSLVVAELAGRSDIIDRE